MTTEELAVAVSGLGWCGCGDPAAAAESLRQILAVHVAHDGQRSQRLQALMPDAGVYFIVLYWLDAQGLTEHGTSVGGAWLTTKGFALLAGLNAQKAASQFEADWKRLRPGRYLIEGWYESGAGMGEYGGWGDPDGGLTILEVLDAAVPA